MTLLKEIVDFLNHNNGTITAIATVVLAVITFWYVWLTRKILKANNQPEILVYLFPSEGYSYQINLYIQNIGTGFASDITFSGNFSSIPQNSFLNIPLQELSVFKNGIDYLGPGKKIELGLFSTHSMGDLINHTLNISVDYIDAMNGKYKDTFLLDFNKWVDFYQDENPIMSAADSLKKIATEIHRVLIQQ